MEISFTWDAVGFPLRAWKLQRGVLNSHPAARAEEQRHFIARG